MGKVWAILSHLHSLAGPTITLLYPLYASVQAMESSSKLDDEQWLSYWILYSFITLMEMVLQSLIYWGAAFIYNKFVREQGKKHNGIMAAHAGSISSSESADKDKLPSPTLKEKKSKRKLLSLAIPKKLRF